MSTAKEGRFDRYVSRIRTEIHSSLTEEHTPHQIALSFAIGTFITMLPTWGVGVLVFFVLIRVFDWINKIALFASVLVFNPVVKWGVYGLSFALGFALLGPVEGVGLSDRPGLGDGSEILIRLLLGNTILAIVATVAAYIAVYRIAAAYEARELPVLENTVDHLVEEIETHENIEETAATRESGQRAKRE